MKTLVNTIAKMFSTKATNLEYLRWAKNEYRKDWEHAYHMLRQGKKPFEGV
jgi:hypothetical protein